MTLTQLTLNLRKPSLMMSLALGTLLALTGCKHEELDDFIQSVKGAADSDEQFCHSSSQPFNHALCSISQSQLSQAQAPLSLRLFWKSGQWQAVENQPQAAIVDQDKSHEPLYKFDTLIKDLPKDSELKFAANAGMYDGNFAPIGYTVIQGRQILSLNLKQGGGNFHLLPNGVLWWDKANHVHITESTQLDAMLKSGEAKPWYATQSGPMLVIDGHIHPKFNNDSTSKKIRNGVGVCEGSQIHFVTSREPVNFYQFARFFKEGLHCDNALFLDGGVASALYAPDVAAQEEKNMGVMVGLIETHPDSQHDQ